MDKRSFFMPKIKGKSKGLEVSTLSGINYSQDKPKECRYCYFWKNNRVGCELGSDNCFYRIPQKQAISECDGCPYGRASPCIGWCTKRILKEMGMTPFQKRGGENGWRMITSTVSSLICSHSTEFRRFYSQTKDFGISQPMPKCYTVYCLIAWVYLPRIDG